MSPLEQSDFKTRDALGSSILGIDKAFSQNLATYGGAWMDQAAGGVLNVAFTEKPSQAVLDQITALIPAGSKLRIDGVPATLAQINALSAQLSDNMVSDAKAGSVVITSTGIVIPQNLVAVTITKAAPPDEEAALVAKYGPLISVTRTDDPSAASSRDIQSGRVYGGEWIGSATPGFNSACTDGYSDIKSATNQTYSITAGHCGYNGTSWRQGLSGSRIIGQVHANTTWGMTASNCDCAPVGPLAAGGYGTNQVLTNGNALFTYTNTGTVYSNEPLCHSGAKTYEDPAHGNNLHITCGTVISTSTTVTYTSCGCPGTYTLRDAIFSNAYDQSGDSGGPVGNGGSFLGLLSGYDGGHNSYITKSTNFGTANVTISYSS
ncbi:hypothetical protein BH10ACT8_BH10ACT8_07310 [soil metagenome]